MRKGTKRALWAAGIALAFPEVWAPRGTSSAQPQQAVPSAARQPAPRLFAVTAVAAVTILAGVVAYLLAAYHQPTQRDVTHISCTPQMRAAQQCAWGRPATQP